jgi:hypothetical protein
MWVIDRAARINGREAAVPDILATDSRSGIMLAGRK